jgi:DNA-damage-inducible protein J
MMLRDDVVRARTNTYLKQSADAVLTRLGMNMTDAINLFLMQITMHDGLPFELKVKPNDEAYKEAKDRLFEQWKKELNEGLDRAEEDIKAGRVYTAEESRSRVAKRLDKYRK